MFLDARRGILSSFLTTLSSLSSVMLAVDDRFNRLRDHLLTVANMCCCTEIPAVESNRN